VTTPPPAPFLASTGRVYSLSVGRLLGSSRVWFLGLLAAVPVLVALGLRLQVAGDSSAGVTAGGAPFAGPEIFGTFVWVAYVRFIVPVLGMWLGTGLIADEVDDRSMAYLVTRAMPRGAILAGKYLAYLVASSAVVLPSLLLTYFALVPAGAVAASFAGVMADLAVAVVGLAAYGALFGWVGAAVRRPLILGLLFVFGWEPLVLMLPGHVKRGSLAFYLQSLVPHALPSAESGLLPQLVVREVLPPAEALAWLGLIVVAALWLGIRAVEHRDV
jgi:ABC-2 type transport system permease protein